MDTKPLLSAEMTVNEIIHRFPATVTVFHRFGINACCGGALPLAEAAARHDGDLAKLLEALAGAVEGEPSPPTPLLR